MYHNFLIELKSILILMICSDTIVVFVCLTAVVICAIQHRPRQVEHIYGH